MGAAVLRAACLLAALAAVLITAQAAAPPTTVGLAGAPPPRRAPPAAGPATQSLPLCLQPGTCSPSTDWTASQQTPAMPASRVQRCGEALLWWRWRRLVAAPVMHAGNHPPALPCPLALQPALMDALCESAGLECQGGGCLGRRAHMRPACSPAPLQTGGTAAAAPQWPCAAWRTAPPSWPTAPSTLCWPRCPTHQSVRSRWGCLVLAAACCAACPPPPAAGGACNQPATCNRVDWNCSSPACAGALCAALLLVRRSGPVLQLARGRGPGKGH